MRRTLTAAIGAVTVAAVLSGAGLAAASASQARPATEHFQGMTTSISGPISTIATGVFTAGGLDFSTSATTDVFKFPGGTITIKHHAGRTTGTFNSRTCLFSDRQRGTYKITGGTGKYKGISGKGTYLATDLGVAARNKKGKCSMTLTPAAIHFVINGHGPVKL